MVDFSGHIATLSLNSPNVLTMMAEAALRNCTCTSHGVVICAGGMKERKMVRSLGIGRLEGNHDSRDPLARIFTITMIGSVVISLALLLLRV